MNAQNAPGMNTGMNIGMNISRRASSSGSEKGMMSFDVSSLMTGWAALGLSVVILIILFAVYYETIGYYIQLGYSKLNWSREQGEVVEIETPGGVTAQLTPASDEDGNGKADSGILGSLMETDVATALSGGSSQVFNINRNVYRFTDAEPLCRAFGAELATYDQVKDAYKAGADWCNYGWVKGQLAVYPTQQSTYDKLQAGPADQRMQCGLPGMNGGYFPNEDQRFGVNCYGPRPAETALDERIASEDREDIAFDREVTKFKAEKGSIAVTPWSSTQWSS
jgi:hypothetical protein